MDGIILDKTRNKTEHKLPKTGATIWLWDDILAGEVLGGLQINATGAIENTNLIKIIVSLIADWNFIDEAQNKIDINEENVKKLPIKDFQYLADKINAITDNSSIVEKKS